MTDNRKSIGMSIPSASLRDPAEVDAVALLNQVCEAHTAREPWQAGDPVRVSASFPSDGATTR